MKKFVVVLILGMISLALSQAPVGVLGVESQNDFATTVQKLEQAIENSPLTLIAKIDHAANAANNGLELRPTTLFIFGNPNVGTPLMQNSQTVAIDLPQKILVWQSETGVIRVGFNNPYYLQARHNLTGQEDRLAIIDNALRGLTKAATE